MSEFSALDPKRPATLEAVLEAVARLSTYDEQEILSLVSEGRLREVFPFRPTRPAELPVDFVPEQALVEASALPLNRDARRRLIEASMRGSPREASARPAQGSGSKAATPAQRPDLAKSTSKT